MPTAFPKSGTANDAPPMQNDTEGENDEVIENADEEIQAEADIEEIESFFASIVPFLVSL